ncbi:hypothetical protein [Dictyobacter kobayashii]|uniref:Uncharacterized protein n=1 Tax=Dictyobacter kobayashii TaxID=2014872 RepID=A0A402ADR6_9CHLR|nr:hypothetical protein [Dictyobacter kobayashii]GCE17245.1 hypothetical protein KDK_10450 [Dictyobacter kobayashii]
MLNDRVPFTTFLRTRAAIFGHDTHAVPDATTGVYAAGVSVFVLPIGVAQRTSVPISWGRPPDIM